MPNRRPAAAVLVLLAALLPAGAGTAARQAEPTSTLAAKLARALAVPHVRPQSSAALAVDLASGKAVFRRNGSLALVPASNEKLAVTYAALVALGPAFRIETTVLGEGGLEAATWHGDLFLKGFGDSTLSSADLRDLAAQVRDLGIRRVKGAIVGDESFFDSRRTAPGWRSYYYVNESPPLSALTVDRTRYHGYVSREPALAAASLFRRALRSAGIAVQGPATTGRADPSAFPVASTLSAPLAAILRFMDRESDNFTAELLLKQLGAVDGARGTTPGGAKVVHSQLAAAGVPLAGVRIVDGSGLSRLNRLTANALVGILRAAWRDPELRTTFLAALPVAGRNGTLTRRMRRPPAIGTVVAKTGTTSESSALSGFVRRRFVFAVLQNGHPVSHYWARRAQDRFASVLAAQ